LRVPERQAGCDADDQVENAAPLFAAPRLALTDQRAVQRARTESHVEFASRDRLDELGRFVDRRGKIGVGKQTDCRGGGEQSFPNGRAFAAIR